VPRTAGMGHEDAFPPTTLSNRSRVGKPTFAGTRGNGRDAPKAGVACQGRGAPHLMRDRMTFAFLL
jgi:hypothetical protein